MAQTTSLAFPRMFDVAKNRVAVITDNQSVVNRTRLLMLTDPTEVYDNPNQGVGLKRYLWQYNGPNVKAAIQDRIREQLRLHEPCCVPDETAFADGLLFSPDEYPDEIQDIQRLKMTVGIKTTYGANLEVQLNVDN